MARKKACNPARGIVENLSGKNSLINKVNTRVKIKLHNKKHIKLTGLNKKAADSKKAISPMPKYSFFILINFLFLIEK